MRVYIQLYIYIYMCVIVYDYVYVLSENVPMLCRSNAVVVFTHLIHCIN
jgi:hypothetical protein